MSEIDSAFNDWLNEEEMEDYMPTAREGWNAGVEWERENIVNVRFKLLDAHVSKLEKSLAKKDEEIKELKAWKEETLFHIPHIDPHKIGCRREIANRDKEIEGLLKQFGLEKDINRNLANANHDYSLKLKSAIDELYHEQTAIARQSIKNRELKSKLEEAREVIELFANDYDNHDVNRIAKSCLEELEK